MSSLTTDELAISQHQIGMTQEVRDTRYTHVKLEHAIRRSNAGYAFETYVFENNSSRLNI